MGSNRMKLVHFAQHLFFPHESNNQRARLIHPSSLLLLIVVVTAFQFLLRQASTSLPQILGYASQIPASEIIRLTNIQRQNKGLPLLSLDPQLTQAAAHKATDMFAQNYWAHVSPAGTQPWSFITDSGYAYRYAGENLARDFADPQSVVNAWMASPSHRENLLNQRYQNIGVAVVDGALSGQETTLVVQMFGTRLSASPPSDIGRTASLTVQAAEPSPAPTSSSLLQPQLLAAQPPVVSPFEINRAFGIGLLGLFAIILTIDLIVVSRRSLTRWTSKSFAHLILVVVLIAATTAILRGRIL